MFALRASSPQPVDITGISIGKACQLLQFFCSLPLERSQAAVYQAVEFSGGGRAGRSLSCDRYYYHVRHEPENSLRALRFTGWLLDDQVLAREAGPRVVRLRLLL